jgi:hypothetical protein
MQRSCMQIRGRWIALVVVIAIVIVGWYMYANNKPTVSNTVSQSSQQSIKQYTPQDNKQRVITTLQGVSQSIIARDTIAFGTFVDIKSLCSSLYDIVSKGLGQLGGLVDKDTIVTGCIQDTIKYVQDGVSVGSGGGSVATTLQQLIANQDSIVTTQQGSEVTAIITAQQQSTAFLFTEHNTRLVLSGIVAQ